jgi:beta-lactamase regulating signal transducer with metallopeptidase domain
MAADLLLTLARCNIAAGVAILMVLALRGPLRRWLGAERAYAAWLIVPLAAAGSLMPAGLAWGSAAAVEVTGERAVAWLSAGDHAQALTFLWLAGVVVGMGVASRRHRRFAAAVKAGRAGPAVVGVIWPRIVVPADYARRFTEEERRLVRAHELAHIERRDGRANAVAALAASVCWFNPLLHLALSAMRLDQELACDAMVLARAPVSRRLYAETLLRTHQATVAPLLACQWTSRGAHPLEARIRMLASKPPGQGRHDLGLAILIVSFFAAFGTAWATRPPIEDAEQPTPVLVDLAPPNAGDANEGAAVYRLMERGHRRPAAAD